MATYLLTWNPNRWSWDELETDIDILKQQGFVEDRWSCGLSKKLQLGDRFFLIRLGEVPRGLMGSGMVISDVFEAEHWDNAKAAKGSTARFVNVRFDVLLNPDTEPILDRLYLLDDPTLSVMHWDTQMSGVQIPDEVADRLEEVWHGLTGRGVMVLPEEVRGDPQLMEGAVRQVSVNAYERNPEARRRCIAHYGPECAVCGMDFGKVYGEIGGGFIHVHHLRPLAELGKTYAVDPITDLRPVCPNCHAMIHRRNPPFTVEEMQQIMALPKKK